VGIEVAFALSVTVAVSDCPQTKGPGDDTTVVVASAASAGAPIMHGLAAAKAAAIAWARKRCWSMRSPVLLAAPPH
jgi:hypothetical protein